MPCDASILARDSDDLPCSYGQLAVLWLQDGSQHSGDDAAAAAAGTTGPLNDRRGHGFDAPLHSDADTGSGSDGTGSLLPAIPQLAPTSTTSGTPLFTYPKPWHGVGGAVLPAQLVHDATCLRVAGAAARKAAESLHPDSVLTLRGGGEVVNDVTGDVDVDVDGRVGPGANAASPSSGCCGDECPCRRAVVPSGWLSVAALSELRLANVQLQQGRLVPALVSAATAAMTSLPGGTTQLDALLLCAHLAGRLLRSDELIPDAAFSAVGVAESAALSPLHWLSEAVQYHPTSSEASLRFAAALASVGQYDVAALWISKVRRHWVVLHSARRERTVRSDSVGHTTLLCLHCSRFTGVHDQRHRPQQRRAAALSTPIQLCAGVVRTAP